MCSIFPFTISLPIFMLLSYNMTILETLEAISGAITKNPWLSSTTLVTWTSLITPWCLTTLWMWRSSSKFLRIQTIIRTFLLYVGSLLLCSYIRKNITWYYSFAAWNHSLWLNHLIYELFSMPQLFLIKLLHITHLLTLKPYFPYSIEEITKLQISSFYFSYQKLLLSFIS